MLENYFSYPTLTGDKRISLAHVGFVECCIVSLWRDSKGHGSSTSEQFYVCLIWNITKKIPCLFSYSK